MPSSLAKCVLLGITKRFDRLSLPRSQLAPCLLKTGRGRALPRQREIRSNANRLNANGPPALGGFVNRLTSQRQGSQDDAIGAIDGHFVRVGEPNGRNAFELR
jgi:hypothetical protein